MQGRSIPLRTPYGEVIQFLQYTGWSWTELNETPFALVHELWLRMTAEQEWKHKAAAMRAESDELERVRGGNSS